MKVLKKLKISDYNDNNVPIDTDEIENVNESFKKITMIIFFCLFKKERSMVFSLCAFLV